jgi:glycosyltransferase involved in cell wall biosynthesis
MILGIDASNIRTGGGITYLANLLASAEPDACGFSTVVVWSGEPTLARLGDRPWLDKRRERALDGRLPSRAAWQSVRLSKAARAAGCDLLYFPGGSYAGSFRPFVALNHNQLLFEPGELWRFGWSPLTAKLLLLRALQSRTFRRADGVVFLTRHGRDVVQTAIGGDVGRAAVVHNGADERFRRQPRAQRPIGTYTGERPFRLLYVSPVLPYKHQWHVAEAVARLRSERLPIELEFVGRGYEPYLTRLRRTMARRDPDGRFLRFSDFVPHEELPDRCARADMAVIASSCEAHPAVLTEAMSAGLPIACANRSALPEVLGDAGAYFDPEDPADIARALRGLIESPERRAACARAAFARAQGASWGAAARDTLGFLAAIARGPSRTRGTAEAST